MSGRRTPTGTLALRMKSTVEPLEGNKVKLSVEVDASEFEPAVDAAFKKIAREVRLPGFRPGKAPRKVLEARLGPLAGREQALQDSLPEYYSAAVIEHDVDVIAAPEIDITGGQEAGDVAFDAVVEVRPSIEVPGYGGLRVTLERPGVDDEALDAQIDRMRDLDSTLEVVDRPAQDGDTVTIDIAGTLDGDAQAGPHRRRLQLHGRLRRHRPRGRRAARRRQGRRHPAASPPRTPIPTRTASCSSSSP